ncbi:unnamed protein product [Spodoptera littoralis]|uniref:Uncharacterized protein n=1 Tax=Spodoptera littoralis TaxID=7109 RepID=A0A9P0IHW9_SPOLI|nr:unnamed protein product [Spodoptera littoralis]CAH1647046.1 unnamed protein product [Spodoptera littoralis]
MNRLICFTVYYLSHLFIYSSYCECTCTSLIQRISKTTATFMILRILSGVLSLFGLFRQRKGRVGYQQVGRWHLNTHFRRNQDQKDKYYTHTLEHYTTQQIVKLLM